MIRSAVLSLFAWTTLLACKDVSDHCPQWSSQGECATNAVYMDHHCKFSCHICKHVDLNDLIADVDVNPEDGSISLQEIVDRLNSLDVVGESRKWIRYQRPLKSGEIAEYVNPDGKHGSETYDGFKALDKNNDGFLDANETRAERDAERVMAADADLPENEALLEKVQVKEENALRMSLADKDRDGRLSLDEYAVYLHGAHRVSMDAEKQIRALAKKQRVKRREMQARRIMRKMDRNGDNVIDQDELATVIEFQMVGSTSTVVQAHTLLADVTHPDGVPLTNASKDEL